MAGLLDFFGPQYDYMQKSVTDKYPAGYGPRLTEKELKQKVEQQKKAAEDRKRKANEAYDTQYGHKPQTSSTLGTQAAQKWSGGLSDADIMRLGAEGGVPFWAITNAMLEAEYANLLNNQAPQTNGNSAPATPTQSGQKATKKQRRTVSSSNQKTVAPSNQPVSYNYNNSSPIIRTGANPDTPYGDITGIINGQANSQPIARTGANDDTPYADINGIIAGQVAQKAAEDKARYDALVKAYAADSAGMHGVVDQNAYRDYVNAGQNAEILEDVMNLYR